MNIKENWIIKKTFFDINAGVSYTQILRYFYPEFITAIIIYTLPQFIDYFFICSLKSTSLYAISGVVENFLTMFTKSAEGLLVGTVVVAGYFNGLKQYKEAGESFVDAFWTTITVGLLVSISLYFGVNVFYKFNNFSPEMIALGTPFLRIKSIGVFFMFVYFSFVGFLRSVKNTFAPMIVFALGSGVFVLTDYLFIFGSFGFPRLGFLGSAVAYMSQYIVMSILMISYIIYDKRYAQYQLSFIPRQLHLQRIKKVLMISLPVLVDKISIAFAYVWLASCVSKLGTTATASYSMIKLMERFAFVPAIGFSQIITFLVSNDLGHGRWDNIHANIRKITLLALIMVGIILIISSLSPSLIVNFFGCEQEVCYIVTAVFPSLSILVMFDLLQLILSAALRGAGDVQTVMKTRCVIIICYFIPATYIISWFQLESVVTKMFVTYAAFLVGNGLMSIMYVLRLRQNHWKKQSLKVVDE